MHGQVNPLLAGWRLDGVIRHQAVAENIYMELLSVCVQQREILQVIGLGEEYLLPTISPLSNVIRKPWNYHTGIAWHIRSVIQSLVRVNLKS